MSASTASTNISPTHPYHPRSILLHAVRPQAPLWPSIFFRLITNPNCLTCFRAASPTAPIGLATSTTPHSTAVDPAETEALRCLEQGTQKLEEGDVEGAKALYRRSVEIKRDAGSLFNLGVTHYHLS